MIRQLMGAGVIAIAVVISAGLWIYFSPYQSCVRAYVAQVTAYGYGEADAKTQAHLVCARR
jgi:hypothetical protein